MEKFMKFIVLAKYSKQGTDGWLENPDEDRKAMVSGLAQKIGGNLIDISYTRGIYDVVVSVEAPSSDTLTALKLTMIKTGAFEEITILEDINLNDIAKKGAEMEKQSKLEQEQNKKNSAKNTSWS